MLKKTKIQKSSKGPQDYKFTQAQLKWLEALESGEYKQGTGQLCEVVFDKNGEVKGYKYCCLGVAGELFCNNAEVEISGDSARYCGKCDFAPPKIQEKLKLNNKEGVFGTHTEEFDDLPGTTLAELNDAGWSFKKIAKFIRNNPTAVFRS